jgi:hypothetical protein
VKPARLTYLLLFCLPAYSFLPTATAEINPSYLNGYPNAFLASCVPDVQATFLALHSFFLVVLGLCLYPICLFVVWILATLLPYCLSDCLSVFMAALLLV